MTLKGFRDMRRKARRMQKKLEDEPPNVVRRKAGEMKHEMKGNVVEMDAVATTRLFRAFNIANRRGPTGDPRIVLSNNAAYAGFVEHGTGPKGDGTYPAPAMGPRLIAGLKEWAIAKPTVNVTFIDAWAKEAALTVSREGTEAQPFFWPVWEANKSGLVARVRSRVRHIVQHS